MALNHHINGNPAQQNGHINTTLPTQSYMLNSGDMRKYMGEMTDSDVERAFDNILTSSPPPVRDLQIDESYETHQTETIVMCDSTHLHVNDTYPPPTGADHPPSNMLIIPSITNPLWPRHAQRPLYSTRPLMIIREIIILKFSWTGRARASRLGCTRTN
uniref:Uncharacterized protein n=1 Tax=Cacopsylla melanoneura TaxID=428564 RepID=A0A8D8M8E5_9HEMI